VVATVQGREVTLRELNLELGGAAPSDPKARKLLEQEALNRIIARKILAKAAVDQGIDKTPDFIVQRGRQIETILAQDLQSKWAAQVPPATPEEAKAYVAAHPDIFAERKIWLVDQIRIGRPRDPAALKALQPLKTLPQVEAQLNQLHIPYQTLQTIFDTVGEDPKFAESIAKLPAGEIFIFPAGEGFLINQIRETKIAPLTGDPATKYAQNLMNRQRTQDVLRRQTAEMMDKARQDVHFNAQYAPAKPVAAPVVKPH
jgi:EpsD family peptidyl-prolyl cis-trans isomerase